MLCTSQSYFVCFYADELFYKNKFINFISFSTGDDISYENEEMLEIVTNAISELIDTRLQLQHRLIVTTCFALVRLNMKYENEDYIKAFLIPVELEQMIWKDISKSRPMKKQGNNKSVDDLEECARKDREEDEESIHTENEQEESIPEWIPKQSDKKVREEIDVR